MTKKEVLRKVLGVFFWLYFFYLTAKLLPGKADYFTSACMFLCWSILALKLILLALNLILIIVLKIEIKVKAYKLYKFLVKGFEYLQAVHKVRYKLYFTGDKEKIEEYSTEIERCGRIILNVGEYEVSNNLFSKKQVNEIIEILDQTKEIITKD